MYSARFLLIIYVFREHIYSTCYIGKKLMRCLVAHRCFSHLHIVSSPIPHKLQMVCVALQLLCTKRIFVFSLPMSIAQAIDYHRYIGRILHLAWWCLYVQFLHFSLSALLTVFFFLLDVDFLNGIQIRMFAVKLKLHLQVIFQWLVHPILVQPPLEGANVGWFNRIVW